MYESFVNFLDATISPTDYQKLLVDDESWNWDRETKVKAQGLKSSLSCFQSNAVFVVTKMYLDEVSKTMFDAYKMVDSSIENIGTTRDVTLMKYSAPCTIPRSFHLLIPLVFLNSSQKDKPSMEPYQCPK